MTLPAFWCGYSIGSRLDHFCHKSLTPYSTPRAKGRIENIKMTAHIPAATLSTHCLQDRIIGANSGCHRKQHKSLAPSEYLWIPRGFIEDFNIFWAGWQWLQWQWILPCCSTPSRTFLMATVFWTWIPLTKLFPSLTAAEFHLVRSVKSSWALWPAPNPPTHYLIDDLLQLNTGSNQWQWPSCLWKQLVVCRCVVASRHSWIAVIHAALKAPW